MRFYVGARADFDSDLLARLERYRHRVFIEKLGWNLRCETGLERDQFDRPDTVYVAALSGDAIVGAARLLPTTRPYLLGDVFPDLLAGQPLPAEPAVWELSRFCAVDFRGSGDSPLAQFSSSVAAALLDRALECASALGASVVVTVSPVGVERLLARNGFSGRRAAPPRVADGQLIAAYYIACTTRNTRTADDVPQHVLEEATA
ncbi:GNAT family N-acetyltransferase [Burkholderia sp. Bp8963]|uniref:acyl-homoserine-lactone synthase n=1 Tax=Burkholderia sp. Bp8963 TaxID=2184547 RepID=UPI000F5A2BB4|nr:acyl-homoserine-lactone synthase [Burkholderia sp. Bp8963]RQS64128.1 GNAT family N-acetyltransferase [Burkholderia sp. Bp8963]